MMQDSMKKDSASEAKDNAVPDAPGGKSLEKKITKVCFLLFVSNWCIVNVFCEHEIQAPLQVPLQ